jgi:hypothetical protein
MKFLSPSLNVQILEGFLFSLHLGLRVIPAREAKFLEKVHHGSRITKHLEHGQIFDNFLIKNFLREFRKTPY